MAYTHIHWDSQSYSVSSTVPLSTQDFVRLWWVHNGSSRAAVLNSSPRTPLFEHKCPAKWTSQDILPWFQFEANIYIPFKVEVCETWIKFLYIYRGVWCHTCPCVKTLRSANPWMNVLKWSKLQQIFPAQGVGNNGHCVGSMSIGTQFMHGAHF